MKLCETEKSTYLHLIKSYKQNNKMRFYRYVSVYMLFCWKLKKITKLKIYKLDILELWSFKEIWCDVTLRDLKTFQGHCTTFTQNLFSFELRD